MEKQRKFGLRKIAGVGLVSCVIGITVMTSPLASDVIHADTTTDASVDIPYQEGVHVSMTEDGLLIKIDDSKQFAEGETIKIVNKTANDSVFPSNLIDGLIFPTGAVTINGTTVGAAYLNRVSRNSYAENKDRLLKELVYKPLEETTKEDLSDIIKAIETPNYEYTNVYEIKFSNYGTINAMKNRQINIKTKVDTTNHEFKHTQMIGSFDGKRVNKKELTNLLSNNSNFKQTTNYMTSKYDLTNIGRSQLIYNGKSIYDYNLTLTYNFITDDELINTSFDKLSFWFGTNYINPNIITYKNHALVNQYDNAVDTGVLAIAVNRPEYSYFGVYKQTQSAKERVFKPGDLKYEIYLNSETSGITIKPEYIDQIIHRQIHAQNKIKTNTKIESNDKSWFKIENNLSENTVEATFDWAITYTKDKIVITNENEIHTPQYLDFLGFLPKVYDGYIDVDPSYVFEHPELWVANPEKTKYILSHIGSHVSVRFYDSLNDELVEKTEASTNYNLLIRQIFASGDNIPHDVVVEFYDNHGNKLKDNVTFKDDVLWSETYNYTPDTISGYNYTGLAEDSAPIKGVVGNQDRVIKLIYRSDAEMTQNIHAKLRNERGEILKDIPLTGKIGNDVAINWGDLAELKKKYQIGDDLPSTWQVKETNEDIVITVKDKTSESAATKDITRTFNMHKPDKSVDTVTQTVSFNGKQVTNLATGEVTYKDWTPTTPNPRFDDFTVPQINGYHLGHHTIDGQHNPNTPPTISGKSVTPDNKNESYDIYYVADEHAIHAKLVDTRNEVVKDVPLTGHTDEKVSIGWGDLSAIREKYEVPSDLISEWSVGVENQDIVITLKDKVTNEPTTKEITRTINVQKPDGQTQQEVQKVTYTGTKHTNRATGEVTYADWSSTHPQFDAYHAPSIQGYTASLEVVPEQVTTVDTENTTVTVTYKENTRTETEHKEVKRNIMILSPNGEWQTVVQPVGVTRTKTIYEGTNRVTYSDWTPEKEMFDAYTPNAIEGYHIDDAKAVPVNPNAEEPIITILMYKPDTSENGTQTDKPDVKDDETQTKATIHVTYKYQDGTIYKEFDVQADKGTVLDGSDLEMLPDNMDFTDDFTTYEVKGDGTDLIERTVKKQTSDSETQTKATIHVAYKYQDGTIYKEFDVQADKGTILDGSDLEMLPDNMDFTDDFTTHEVKGDGTDLIERTVKKQTSDSETQTKATIHVVYKNVDGTIYKEFDVQADKGSILDGSDLEMLPDNMDFTDDFTTYEVKGDGTDTIERTVKKQTADSETQTKATIHVVYKNADGTIYKEFDVQADKGSILDGSDLEMLPDNMDFTDDFTTYEVKGDGTDLIERTVKKQTSDSETQTDKPDVKDDETQTKATIHVVYKNVDGTIYKEFDVQADKGSILDGSDLEMLPDDMDFTDDFTTYEVKGDGTDHIERTVKKQTSDNGTQTDNPDTSDNGTQTEVPNTSDNGTQTEVPNTSENGTQTEVPNTSENGTQTEVPNTSENGTQTEVPNTSENGTQTEVPNTSENDTQTEVPNTSDNGTQTEVPNTSDNGTQTEVPNTSENGTQTDKPNSSDNGTQTDKPNSSDNGTQTDKPNSSDNGTQTDKPNSSDNGTQTDKPNTSDNGTQTDKPNTSDNGTQTDKPNSSDNGTQTKDTQKDKPKVVKVSQSNKPTTKAELPKTGTQATFTHMMGLAFIGLTSLFGFRKHKEEE